MKKYTFFLLLILLTGCASSRKAHVSATPDGKQYVVILSMDAFRWDLAGRSHTPTLDSLARAGTYAEIYPVYPTPSPAITPWPRACIPTTTGS